MIDNATLITGGAGFLGNTLAQYLNSHGILVAVADSKFRLENYAVMVDGVDYMEMNWPNPDKLSHVITRRKFTHIIHLAWSSNPTMSMYDIVNDASSNIIGTLRLLDLIRADSISKFVFMSSGGTVYGNTQEDLISESHPTNPVSSYGISKLACENYVNLYALRNNFTPLIVRLGNPYGTYQLNGTPTGVIANFIRKIFADASIDLYGDGGSVRDYIHIEDVVSLLERLIYHSTASGIYNLGSGTGVTVTDIINTIKSNTDRAVVLNTLQSRRSDVRSIVLDISKLQAVVPNEKMVPIESGIRSMIKSMNDTTIGPAKRFRDHDRAIVSDRPLVLNKP